MLDLRRLRLLSELARRGTISSVAAAVGYTPSAVSQSLIALEREAGVTLLERDGRRVRLTPAAHALVARTDRALAELDVAAAELAAAQGTVGGRVAIGAFPSAAMRLVVPAVRAATAAAPELVCAIGEHEPEDGIPLLRAGVIDLLVSERNDDVEPSPAGGLEEHALLTEPLLLVLPTSHPVERGGPVDLATLSGAAWIGGRAGTQFAAAAERACRAAGFAPRFEHHADEAAVVEALVAAGLGVGFLPRLACTPAPGVRHVTARPEPPRRHITALVRRGAARRPAVEAVLGALRAASADATATARAGGGQTR